MDGASHTRSQTQLMGAEEVARLMGVKESTVWRWCREGTMPCLKVGKHWRVRRAALESFLKSSERRSSTLVGQLGSFLRVPDNVLAIAENKEVLHRLDAAFFRVGEARDGVLVKFHGGEDRSEAELVRRFESNGLEARRLVREGRLLMRPEEVGAEEGGGGRGEVLGGMLEEAREGRVVWASFDWVVEVELEAALEQQERLAEVVGAGQLVVKTAAIEGALEEWKAGTLVRAQSSHSGTILASERGLWLARATPMPPS